MKEYLRLMVLFSVCIIGIYVFRFHGGISNDPIIWGSFGSYLAGTLTIIVLILSLYAGLKTFEKDKNINKLNLLFLPFLKELIEIQSMINESIMASGDEKLLSNARLKWRYITVAYGSLLKSLIDVDEYIIVSEEISLYCNQLNFESFIKQCRSDSIIPEVIDVRVKGFQDMIEYTEIQLLTESVGSVKYDYMCKAISQFKVFIEWGNNYKLMINPESEAKDILNLHWENYQMYDISKIVTLLVKVQSLLAILISNTWKNEID